MRATPEPGEDNQGPRNAWSDMDTTDASEYLEGIEADIILQCVFLYIYQIIELWTKSCP